MTSPDDLNVIVVQVETTGIWDVSCFNPICGHGLHGVGEDPSKGKAEAMARRHRLEIRREQARQGEQDQQAERAASVDWRARALRAEADRDRALRDAAQCARNTDAAASIIREALQTGHREGATAGMRALYALAADVEGAGLLDGLPDLNPWAFAPSDGEHDDGACSECGSTEGDIWPIAGKPGYFCRACCIKLTGADPAQPAPVSDLLGADPDWTGGQSVDDHVRENRR